MVDSDPNSQRVSYTSSHWNRYLTDTAVAEGVKASIKEMAKVAGNNGQHFLRADVRDAFAVDVLQGVVATIMWGYPRGVYPGGKSFLPVFAEGQRIVEAIKALQSLPTPTAADVCGRLSVVKGMGPSTYTKIAHFAGITCVDGQCLIYDQMVMRAISESSEPEFGKLKCKLGPCRNNDNSFRVIYQYQQRATYGLFISAARCLAKNLNTTPENIEYNLFMKAPHRTSTSFSHRPPCGTPVT